MEMCVSGVVSQTFLFHNTPNFFFKAAYWPGLVLLERDTYEAARMPEPTDTFYVR